MLDKKVTKQPKVPIIPPVTRPAAERSTPDNGLMPCTPWIRRIVDRFYPMLIACLSWPVNDADASTLTHADPLCLVPRKGTFARTRPR